MPFQLLPKSAAAFAPRSAPNIVLDNMVEPWLTQAIKRVNSANKIKRPLHNVPQHFRCLTEILGGEDAIWTLCSILFPKTPDADLHKHDDSAVEAMSNYNMVHVQAYVVHVDLVSQNEVAYKLTTGTIDALVQYHRDIYSVDTAASLYGWPEKDAQVKRMQEDFVQAANRFVFRTSARALEGLEDSGSGELLEGRAEHVKRAVMNLFAPLLPPPPRMEDVVIPTQSFAQQMPHPGWWQQHQYVVPTTPSMDAWHVLPSTPDPSMIPLSDPSAPHYWTQTSTDGGIEHLQLSSPSSASSQYDFSSCDSSLYGSPQIMPVMPVMPIMASLPMMYPSQLPLHCGADMGTPHMDSFGLGFSSFAVPQFAATM